MTTSKNKLIEVRISSSGAPRNVNLSQFTGNTENLAGRCRLHINTALPSADVWIVIEDLKDPEEFCLVPTGNIVYLTAEPARTPGYLSEEPGMLEFLNQFPSFQTCLDYCGMHGSAAPPFLPWMINANHGDSILAEHHRDISFFRNLRFLDKPREISVFCSTQQFTPEHRMRLRFVEHLASHLGNRLDWFGNGVNSLTEKWEGIAPYRYSVALENQAATNVITEKIQDVFLGLGYPIYWGAPNVGDFFPSDAFLQIDIRDFKGAVQQIDELLDQDPYVDRINAVLAAKKVVLDDMNFTHRLAKIADHLSAASQDQSPHRTLLKSTRSFASSTARLKTATLLARGGRGLIRAASHLSRS